MTTELYYVWRLYAHWPDGPMYLGFPVAARKQDAAVMILHAYEMMKNKYDVPDHAVWTCEPTFV